MRVVKSAPFLAVLLLAGGCVTNQKENAAHAPVVTGLSTKSMTVGDQELKYGVYVPSDYDAKKKWPLIIFLHGMGERGDDGVLQTQVGIGPAIQKNPERFPCVVVMPQCPKSSVWNDRHDIIAEASARSLADYNIDESRIVLTGLSMGGYGTWSYGAAHVKMFAALLPVCGGGMPEDAPTLAKVPIRVYHGGADGVVKPELSRAMADAIKKAGGDIAYTEYPGVGHNSWDLTYGDPKVIEWMLAQKK